MTEPADPYRLLDPATLADPYPLYARLREEAPAYYSEAWRAWLVTRYDDVLAGFRDARLSSDRARAYAANIPKEVLEPLRPLLDNLGSWALLIDPPRHTRIRGLLNRAFTPRLMEALRPRVERLVEDLCDRIAAKGAEMDVMADMAVPLPMAVIAALLGVRAEDGHRLKAWSDALAHFMSAGRPTPEIAAPAVRGVVEMEAYFREIIADRRRAPREDLISALCAAQDEGQILDDRELLSTCSMVLFGGHETTTNLIGNAMNLLLSLPDERARLRDAPASIPTAVEEFLRFDPPVQRMGRIAAVDLSIAGARIQKGQHVFLVMGSANRDPAQFPDADRLDLTRRENRHLTLGMGAHYCIGAALGRIEGELAIGALVRRFPDLRPAPEPPTRLHTATIRGFTRLPAIV